MTVRTHLGAGAPAPSAPPSVNVRPSPCRPRALRDLPTHFCSSSLSTSNCEDGSSLPTEPRIWLLSESVLFTHLKLCHWRSRAGDQAAGVSPPAPCLSGRLPGFQLMSLPRVYRLPLTSSRLALPCKRGIPVPGSQQGSWPGAISGVSCGKALRPGLPLTPPAHTGRAHTESHPVLTGQRRRKAAWMEGARPACTSDRGSPTGEEGGLDQSVLACFLYSVSSSLISLSLQFTFASPNKSGGSISYHALQISSKIEF